jgi:putative PEP-CTERM system histidine kinase
VLLGGLACFDILLCADLVLFHAASPALSGGRAVAMILIAPLLVIAAIRGQRWDGQIKLSRSAVFHSATLVLSGAVLLALTLSGELLRRVGGDWGGVAEISMLFAGLIGLALLFSSRSARSLLQRTLVQHFFADRYDYRRQWLECIDTLSGTGSDERTALHTRAIRAVADVVDSPRGVLFLREGGVGAFAWAGSWNMPAGSLLPAEHPVIAAMRGGEWIVDVGRLEPAAASTPPLQELGKVWLAIPLLHQAQLIGVVVVAPPRIPFRTDQEVFDLLRIRGREVATSIVEQRATQVMVQTRHLHDYSKRFAFVAHDIKNVTSQLALLLRNAEHHIANPEFQKDMLETVSASVQKIDALLKRLESPEADRAPAALTPVPRLEALLATYRRVRRAQLTLEHDGSTATVAMSPDAFDTAVTHLLNNAVEASSGLAIQVQVRHEVARVVIDIVDRGPGMTPDFVRDQLFRPFSTQKQGGTGIGAFQARELLREAGGDLVVISDRGIGTTMRIVLARADEPGPAQGLRVAVTEAGG